MKTLMQYDDAARDLIEEIEQWIPMLADLVVADKDGTITPVGRERKARLLSAFQQLRTLRDKHGPALDEARERIKANYPKRAEELKLL